METKVERQLCRKIRKVVEQFDNLFLEYSVGKGELSDARRRDMEFVKELKNVVIMMVTMRKLGELKMYRWFMDSEYEFIIKLTPLDVKVSMSKMR